MRQVVAYKGLKTMKIMKPSARKLVAVAYKAWSFFRGSNHSSSTGKILMFWMGE